MTNRIVYVAVTVALIAVFARCDNSSTRFVVVESNAAPAEASEERDGNAQAEASEEETAAIEDAVLTALSVDDRPFEDRLEALDDGDDLEPTFEAVRDFVTGLDVEIAVESVTVAGNAATATTSVLVDGEPFQTDLPVTLIKDRDTWKVTRDGACVLLALASPCPDA